MAITTCGSYWLRKSIQKYRRSFRRLDTHAALPNSIKAHKLAKYSKRHPSQAPDSKHVAETCVADLSLDALIPQSYWDSLLESAFAALDSPPAKLDWDLK